MSKITKTYYGEAAAPAEGPAATEPGRFVRLDKGHASMEGCLDLLKQVVRPGMDYRVVLVSQGAGNSFHSVQVVKSGRVFELDLPVPDEE